MGFFGGFSRRGKADSEPLQKRDSQGDSRAAKVRIFPVPPPGGAADCGRNGEPS
jgi:hypothetical protein